MPLFSHLSIPAAELYVLRFVLTKNERSVLTCHQKYAPLIEFAELEFAPAKKKRILVSADRQVIGRLTSTHLNLIQANANAWTQLFVWFPAVRRFEDGDEARLLLRAGVDLGMAVMGAGVKLSIR
jgi:hypothetical protein